MISERVLYNFLFLSLPFIYYPLFPNGPETQPFIPLGICIILFLGKNCKFYISKDNLSLFIGIAFIIFHFLFIGRFGVSKTLGFISYLIGPTFIFLLNFKRFTSLVSSKVVVYLTRFYFAIGLLSLTTISVVQDILKLFHSPLPRYSINSFNSLRGFSFLTPEPSYTLFMFAFIFLVSSEIYSQQRLKKSQLNEIIILLVLCSLISKSVLSIIVLLSIITISHFNRKFTLVKLISTIGMFSIFLISYVTLFNKSRLASLFEAILKIDFQNQGFDILIAFDSSFASRIVANYFAYSSILITGIGVGIGNAQDLLFDIIMNSNNGTLINQIDVFVNNSSYKPQTYLSNLVMDIGLFSLPFIYFFLMILIKTIKWRRFEWFIYILITVIVVQGQITNPLIWLTISYLLHLDFYEKKEIAINND